MNNKKSEKRKSQGEGEIKTLIHYIGHGHLASWDLHRCTSAITNSIASLKWGLGKQGNGASTKKTWESFKLSEKEAEEKKNG